MPASPDQFPVNEPFALQAMVSERELMEALRLSRTTLWRMRTRGMPTITLGRSVRYDLDRVRRWLDEQSPSDRREGGQASPVHELPDCHWQLSVALDPKHRPQEPNRPSSTVRREWWRYPQEAHLLDRYGARYRRLTADEVCILQDFPPGWGRAATEDELILIRGYGDAVPPRLAQTIMASLASFAQAPISTTVEICAGFGGMALGKARALPHARHLALFDKWPVACEVLRASGAFQADAIREVDLNDVNWTEFAGQVDLLTGGPPCQPWSQAGHGKGQADERDLLGRMPSIVGHVRPRFFVFENVPGLLSGENEPYARELIERLRNCGGWDSYGVAMGILNAADFGLPQTRRRVFIVGMAGQRTSDIHRFLDFVHGKRTHASPRLAAALKLEPWVSLSEAIPDWAHAKARWRQWPQTAATASADESAPPSSQDLRVGTPSPSPRRRVRIGLDWPSRGLQAQLHSDGWRVTEVADQLTEGSLLPLMPEQNGADPFVDPWFVTGEPTSALVALRRVCGRRAKFVYFDVPRIRTNAGSFDSAEREALLDTWLTAAQAMLRRAFSLLSDDGVLAALCGIEETHFVRLLMDEIAGPTNHVGTIAWQKNYSPRNMPGMRETSPTHDNIVVFARRKESLPPVALKVPPDGFSNCDGDPRGPWTAEQKGANKPDCDYEVNICPYRWSIVSGQLPRGMWRINPKSGVIWAREGDLRTVEQSTFTVQVVDQAGNRAERVFTIDVSDEHAEPAAASIPWLERTDGIDRTGQLRIETQTLPPAKLGRQYSACVVAAGGRPFTGVTRPGKTAADGKGRYWEFPLSTLLQRAAVDAVDFKNKNDAIPAPKTYLDGAEFTRLNQTSLWLGASKSSVGDCGYSQDAKKELDDLIKAGAITETVGISKPGRLMARLVALFGRPDGLVIDVGSPAAEMASVATAMGRHAVYVNVGAHGAIREGLLRRRLEYAASGAHPLPDAVAFVGTASGSSPTGYLVDGLPRPTGPARVYAVKLADAFATLDLETSTAALAYESYPADSAEFLRALASLEGLIPATTIEPPLVGASFDNSLLAVHAGSKTKLDRAVIDALIAQFAHRVGANGVLRIYYHRGLAPNTIDAPCRLELRRIPFELNLMAGLA